MKKSIKNNAFQMETYENQIVMVSKVLKMKANPFSIHYQL